MDFGIYAGDTNKTIYVRLRDSTTGLAKTGLAYNSAGAVCSYVLPGAARAAITLATQTVTGAHSDGGFVQVDATNCKGLYRLDLPDAAIASGAFTIIAIEFDDTIEESIQIPLHTRKVNVTQWNGTAVATPATAGYPAVTLKVGTGTGEVNLSSGKAPATIAAGDIAASAITATSIASNAITSAKIAASAIGASQIATDAITAAKIAADAIGASELAADAVAEIQNGLATASALSTAQTDLNTLTGSDGVTLATSQPNYAPATAAALATAQTDLDTITGSDGVTIASGTQTFNITGNVTGNLSGSVGSVTGAVGSVTGAVGSVTGNVGGNVTGSVGSVLGGIDTSGGTITTLDALDTAQDTQHASTLSKMLKYFQLLFRKDAAIATDNSTELTAVNADGGSGAGSYDNTTESAEAIRDHIADGTNLTEAGGTGDHLTDLGGMSTAMKAEVNAEADTALSDYAPSQAGDAMALTSGERNSLAAVIETFIVNEGDATAVIQAIADNIAADWVAGDASPVAIATAVWAAATRTLTANTNLNDPTAASIRDAILDRGLAGNHDTDGTPGMLLQLLEADKYVDTSVTPWALVYMVRGSGGIGVGTELLRQTMKDTGGSNVTATTTVIGQVVE